MFSTSRQKKTVTRTRELASFAALLFLIASIANGKCFGQADSNKTSDGGAAKPPPVGSSETSKAAGSKEPLTDRERAELLELIKNLQERVAKLEAAQTTNKTTAEPVAKPVSDSPIADGSQPVSPPSTDTSGKADKNKNADGEITWGNYTPNLGYKVVNTEYGDMSISIYSYVRYLNQLGLDPSYTDAFGNIKEVQRRQDVQLLKLQIKFLGWILNPKLRYFLYAWTSNANQGQGAQTVLAGNIQYSFNKYFTLGGGIRSLPGTRSVEGNFPFWPNVDSRMIADEFMRPSYTSGIWAMGNITDRLKYITMLGNNMSTLGVPAVRIDNGLNTWSNALIWFPTGDFEKGFSGQGWGDFEHHDDFSTRLAFHYSRSDENRESQPSSETFENTQLRLSDGTVIFTPEIFGKGVTVTDARWQMMSYDGAFKYKGYSLEGEYYLRWIDNFKGTNVDDVPSLFDHGFQIQATTMLVPKSLQAYGGYSKIFGEYGNPWDFRVGANFFPFKNKVLRWNNEALYLHRSPVGYTSVPFPVGGRGWAFHSSMELAF